MKEAVEGDRFPRPLAAELRLCGWLVVRVQVVLGGEEVIGEFSPRDFNREFSFDAEFDDVVSGLELRRGQGFDPGTYLSGPATR